METTEKTTTQSIEALNDLVQINNDRIEGYEKAANEVKDTFDAEIKTLFYQMAEESRSYKDSLVEAVIRLGGKPATTESTTSGKIYRAWMDVKATFSGNDVLAALQSCEFGEDAALKAYRDALNEDLPNGISSLVQSQFESLRASHDRIKRYRDEFAAAAKSK